MQAFIRAQWDKKGAWAWFFSPLGLLVCLAARFKRAAYQRGWLKQSRLPVPVIVVGNLTVGGSGKTPLVAYLAREMAAQGFHPGIICRGYRGKATHWPQRVTAASDPRMVGDEAVLLATVTGCPVAAGPNRHAAGAHLLEESDCDLLISDDGFQHLRLARDIDILVYENTHDKPFGNGWCMPSGPLREPASAARAADLHVFHGPDRSSRGYVMALEPGAVYGLRDHASADLETLRNAPLHAIAGIGRPRRFFQSLADLGLQLIEHPFDDHHAYRLQELQFDDDYDLITTEKDAIKLVGLTLERKVWVLPVAARLPQQFTGDILRKLAETRN